MEMIIDFPGGSRVDAHFGSFTVANHSLAHHPAAHPNNRTVTQRPPRHHPEGLGRCGPQPAD